MIREEDLEISVRHTSSYGGQTTGQYDSYVRVTHKPTGITVECDSERSQMRNKALAIEELERQLTAFDKIDIDEVLEGE
jgi:peptide chain release factor 2